VHRFSAFLLLLGVLACAAPPPPVASVALPPDSGAVRLVVNGGNLLTASRIARVTYAVGPGTGPYFEPFLGQLSFVGTGWTGSMTGIPAGTGRTLSLTGWDAGGIAAYGGSARLDVPAGTTVNVATMLQELPAAPPPPVNSPVVNFLSVSADPVPAGATVTLTAGVDPPPAGTTYTYAWVASCGTFSDPTALTAVWTAPATALARCNLSFTASTLQAATTLNLVLTVQPDASSRALSGRRWVTCWKDPPPGYSVASQISSPAPFVQSFMAPQVLVQSSPGAWTSYSGGQLLADGSFLPGSFGPDGSFFIPQVPSSALILFSFTDAKGVRWLMDTNASAIDLGYDLLGRCDQVLASPTTLVDFNLLGLYPWNPDGSLLQATSSGAGIWTPLPAPTGISPGGMDGISSLSWGAPLNLFTGEDVLWLHELTVIRHPDGLIYRAAIAAGKQSGVGLVDHAANSFDLTLDWLPRTASLPVSWSPGDFELHLPSMAPALRLVVGQVAPHRLSVLAHPYSLLAPSPTPPGGSPELVVMDLPAGAAALNLSAPLRYARFLPPSWQELREVRYAAAVAYQAPGATVPVYVVSAVGRRDALPAAAGLIVPVITPVQAPVINGTTALADQAAPVTATPTFSWAPPLLGGASHYVVEINLLNVAGGVTTSTTVARYLTHTTSVTLPPGILNPGGLYFARVTAFAGVAPYDVAPFRYGPVFAYADTLTGTFTP
jgi:hypothetical protein